MQDSEERAAGGGKAGSRGQEGQQSWRSFRSVGGEVAQATGAIVGPIEVHALWGLLSVFGERDPSWKRQRRNPERAGAISPGSQWRKDVRSAVSGQTEGGSRKGGG